MLQGTHTTAAAVKCYAGELYVYSYVDKVTILDILITYSVGGTHYYIVCVLGMLSVTGGL